MANTNVETLAKAMNITPRRIQQLAKEGMPKAERGEYDLGVCMAWYIRFLQKALEQRQRQDPEQRDESLEFTRERARLAREQADGNALKNAEARRDLARISLFERVLGQVASAFRTNTLAIPTKLAPELEGLNAQQIKAALERECRGLLDILAALDLRNWQGVSGGDAGAETGARTTKANGERVGRHVPRGQPRGKREARAVED